MANEFKIKKGLIVTGASGGTVVDIQGSQGQLFSVTDDLSGSIFAVSDISGVPIFDVNSSGLSTFDGNVNLPDNKKILLGTGNDLEIYHDGSNSYIDETGTGSLYNRTTLFIVQNTDSTKNSIIGNPAADVKLYYNGVKKFETTSTGVSVTGEVEATSLDINGNADISGTLSGNFVVRSTNNANIDGANFAVDTTNKSASEYAYEVLRSGTTVAGITMVGKITGTELEGTSLDINGNADISGNLTGVDTLTATTFSGDLNGTINTVTTATTKGNSTNDTTVATTAFVQNVIGTIPAGLVFQGTWNASTNTPTLTSGSGTTGNFYIVSVAGSTNLDGITDWKVGDWAVFIEQGASDQWEKIDNSSVLDGIGTGGSVAGWAGSGTSNTLTDAPITFTSAKVEIPRNIEVITSGYPYIDLGVSSSNYFRIIHDNPNDILKIGKNGASTASSVIINPSGDVGIGTASFGHFTNAKELLIEGDAVNTNSVVQVISNDNNSSLAIYSGASSTDDPAIIYQNDLRFGSTTDVGLVGYTERMRINSSGNVLINQTSGVSETKLYVEGSAMPATGDAASVEDMFTLYRYGSATVWSGAASLALGRYSTGGSSFPKSRLDFKLKDASGTNTALPETTVMTMQSNGAVGIGTTNPSAKLDVAGDLRIDGYSTTTNEAGLYLFNNIAYSMASLANCNNSYNAFRIRGRNSATNTLGIGSNGDSDYVLQVVNDAGTVSGNISLNPYGGNVGIGTASPEGILQIARPSNAVYDGTNDSGQSNIGASVTITNTNTTVNSFAQINMQVSASSNRAVGRIVTIARGSASSDMAFVTESFGVRAEKMRIDQTGNVGIGTANPDGNLEVVTSTIVSGASDTVNNVLIGLQAADRPTIILDTADTTYTNRTWNITNVGSAGKLFIGRNGLDVMVMDNSGNVGIGTTSPRNDSGFVTLQVGDTTTAASQIVLDDNDTNGPWRIISNQSLIINDDATERMRINSAGAIQFNAYNSTNNTGTPTYLLGTDASGNVVKTNTVPGSGAGPYLPLSAGSSYPLTGPLYITSDGGAANGAEIYLKHANNNTTDTIGTLFFGNNADATLSSIVVETNGANNTSNLKLNTSNAGTMSTALTLQGDNDAIFTGNVGIGTTTPDEKLDVENGNIRLKSNSDGNTGIFRMYDASGTESGQIYPAGGDLKIYSPNDILFTQTGKVGIGTTNPGSKLVVAGGTDTAYNDGTLKVVGSIALNAANNLNPSLNRWALRPRAAGVEGSFDIYDARNSLSRLTIVNSGNVGIGEASPTAKLEIYNSGGTVLNVTGSQGQLFSVTDNLSGSIFAVSDISGVPIFDVNSSGVSTFAGTVTAASGTFSNLTSTKFPVAGTGGLLENSILYKLNYNAIGLDTTGRQFFGNNFHTISNAVALNLHAGLTSSVNLKGNGADILVASTGGNVNIPNGKLGIGMTTAPSYELDVAGTIRATGDVIAYSDVRVKENIKTIDNSLEKVSKLRGVEFNKIGDNKKSIGVIAQEIEKVIPEVVKEDDKGMKSVAYGNISGLLIEAIKELKAEIEELKLNKCNCNK